MQELYEADCLAKSILYDIMTGELSWEDEKVQLFLPIATYFTNWHWLELMAENILIEEDAKIVKKFIKEAKAIAKHNEDILNISIENKFKKMTGGL